MVNKTVLFFLATFLACQVSEGKLVPQPRDLVDVALDVLTKLLQSVSALIDQTLELAKKALDSAGLDQIQQDIIKATDEALAKAKEELKEQLESLKNSTSQTGIDIIDCAEKAEDDVESNVHNAVNASSACVSQAIEEIVADLEAVISDLEKANADIKQYEDLSTLCKESGDKPQCVLEYLQMIIETVEGMGDQVSKDFEKVVEDMNKLGEVEKTCIAPNLDDLDKKNQQCFSDFAQCVEDKMKP